MSEEETKEPAPKPITTRSDAAALMGAKGGWSGFGAKKRRPSSHYKKLAQQKKKEAAERRRQK